jgi:outer membrane biosynthesis protein TonB
MLNETTSMMTIRNIDNPWRRLPWTLPSALLLWSLALWGLACFMATPTISRPVEQPPIEAQLIEKFASPATERVQPARPAVVRQPKALQIIKPQQVPVRPQVSPRTEQNPVAAQKTEVTTSNAVALPAAATSVSAPSTPSPVVASPSGSQTGSHNEKGAPHGNMYANSGARAIFKPMPQIPDDLRDVVFSSTALARFHIAVDGSVTVELAKPTPNPRFNRMLLNSLNKWRFIPAIKNGKPATSTEEIAVKIEVK